LIHELAERGVGVRNLADPIRVDSSNPSDPMAQLAVVLLALFGQMERTYTLERAAHARAVRPPRAGGSAARRSSTRTSWRTRLTCATAATALRDRRQVWNPSYQPVPAPATPTCGAAHRGAGERAAVAK